MKTIWWDQGRVFLINQRELPTTLKYIECRDADCVVKAIRNLEIRGAPAIGVAAAMSLALTAYNSKATERRELEKELEECAIIIKGARPTASNPSWALDRVLDRAYTTIGSVESVKETIIKEVLTLADEDVHTNKLIAVHGSALLESGDVVGTICNAGWLATSGEYGTALGIIKFAHEQGKKISVIALETRPVLQGARLTAFELQQDGIAVKVIPDGAIGYCFSKGMIDKFICGADRIVWSSGCHTFNKIGTYTASIAAWWHHVPFYVAAPYSTFDFTHRLDDILIEERDQKEVTEIFGHRIVPEDVPALNPAFDITPPSLISAIITEHGINYPPFKTHITPLNRPEHSLGK